MGEKISSSGRPVFAEMSFCVAVCVLRQEGCLDHRKCEAHRRDARGVHHLQRRGGDFLTHIEHACNGDPSSMLSEMRLLSGIGDRDWRWGGGGPRERAPQMEH